MRSARSRYPTAAILGGSEMNQRGGPVERRRELAAVPAPVQRALVRLEARTARVDVHDEAGPAQHGHEAGAPRAGGPEAVRRKVDMPAIGGRDELPGLFADSGHRSRDRVD